MNKLQQRKINHVAFVVDGSGSMGRHAAAVVKVIDNQVRFLAQLSRDMDMETRVTVYIFDDQVECVIFDLDVLRLPSIADLYWVRGQTALIDAVVMSQDELAQTFCKYGDHAFLTYVFTDGHENASRRNTASTLRSLLAAQGQEWTVAGLVPDINSKMSLEACGVPKGNIAIWDTSSTTGVEEAGSEIQASTQDYFNLRASGVNNTKNLFSTDATRVNAATIKAAGITPLPTDKYVIVPVPAPPDGSPVSKKLGEKVWEIATFVRSVNANKYTAGDTFYELHKSERVAGNKRVMVLEKDTGKVFVGDGVRALIGLSDTDQRVMPDFNDKYTIFVQSTSENRHLKRHTRVIIIK